jgi:CheY-like chemotaxis protein
MNLCINARDAMNHAGTIRLELHAMQALGAACTSCRQLVAGPYLELAVSDSGPGIPDDVMERMFEPFFTTKEVGKGSGMGLATVHGIVHEYGGHVLVATRAGAGTTFRILLPPLPHAQHADEEARRETRSARALPTRLSGRVLVVDDEEMVAQLMYDMLSGWGLQTTVMRNPLEAHDWFAQDPARIDLVLSDYTMPRLTGLELAQRLTLLRPELPVLLYSGYGTDIDPREASRHGVCGVFSKPVEPNTLIDILREHLPSADVT